MNQKILFHLNAGNLEAQNYDFILEISGFSSSNGSNTHL